MKIIYASNSTKKKRGRNVGNFVSKNKTFVHVTQK